MGKMRQELEKKADRAPGFDGREDGPGHGDTVLAYKNLLEGE